MKNPLAFACSIGRQRGSVLTAAGDRLYKTAEEVEAQLLRAQGDLSQSDVELSGCQLSML